MSNLEPIWDPELHLEQVYRRGRRLRKRRHMGALAGGMLAVLVVVAAVSAMVGTGRGSDQLQRVATAGRGQPSGSTSPSATGTGGNGGATVSTVTTGPGRAGGVSSATSTSTASTVSPSTRPGRTISPTPTTGAGTTTTTGPPPPTTTAAPLGACGPGDLVYTTTTNQRSYAAESSVVIDLVARNVSTHTCNGPSNAGISASAVVRNSAGAQVFRSTPIAITCTATCTPPVLAPGASTSYGAGSWVSAAPPGSYSAVASRASVTGAPASFTIT
jgi:hypothetical protein